MFQRLFGKLISLAHTRPDIAYAISVTSRFMHDPRSSHIQATYKIFHYLKGNLGNEILFEKSDSLILEAYIDVDYTGLVMDKSQLWAIVLFSVEIC